ncbi:MAG: hypothetical protein ACRC0R_04500 [Cetobacterium sp.]
MRNRLNLKTICKIVSLSIQIRNLEKELNSLSDKTGIKAHKIKFEIIKLKRGKMELELGKKSWF